MKILVTGGAGYIGSFMVKTLLDEGHMVVMADSLERGYENQIDRRAVFQKGNLMDKEFVDRLFQGIHFDGVIHFAGYISVGESMQKPSIYFENNVIPSINILEKMIQNRVNNFIFSSTAAVYGSPREIPIPESHPRNPESPYGESKVMVERILSWYYKVHGVSYACLRYFNAAGAAIDGSMGERHNPETHLIPNAILSVLKNEEFNLFGDDYKTHDGTCIRDYIHVLDLVKAHLLALKKLQTDPHEYHFNVGTGNGFSNKEVLSMVREVSNSDLRVKLVARRSGDSDSLVADVTKIKEELGFIPQYSDLNTIIKSAWEWHKKT